MLPAHHAYTNCVTATIRKFISENSGQMGSDAAKAAREIYRIALDSDIGLRVPLGLDALELARSQLELVKKDVGAAGQWSTDLAIVAE